MIVIRLCRRTVKAVHHADHAGLVIEVDEFSGDVAACFPCLGAVLPNKPAQIIITIAGIVRIRTVAAHSGIGVISIALGCSQTVSVIGEGAIIINRARLGSGSTEDPGELILFLGAFFDVVDHRTAHGVADDCDDVIYIVPVLPPAVKKKTPRP